MTNFKSCILSTILIILIIPICTLADQDLLLSKKVNKINVLPHIAVNPINGDLLVVWSQYDSTDWFYGRVWSCLVKKKGDKYKVKKPRMISPNSGYHEKPRVAWIPGNNEFLVVWDEYATWEASPISAQRVKAKSGKPVGASFKLVSNSHVNFSPYVHARIIEDQPEITLLYSRFVQVSAAPSQVFSNASEVLTQPLSPNYKTSGKSKKVFACDEGEPGEDTICESTVGLAFAVDSTCNCKCEISIFEEFVPPSHRIVFVYLIKDGVAIDKDKFESTALPYNQDALLTYSLSADKQSAVVVQKGVVPDDMITYTIEIEGECEQLKVTEYSASEAEIEREERGKMFAMFPLFSGSGNGPTNVSRPSKTKVFHNIVEFDNGWAYLFSLEGKKSLKVTSGEKLFPHNNKIRDLEAIYTTTRNGESIASSNLNAAVVWTSTKDPTNFEIRLHIISPSN